jgi:DNA-binding NarL/FixJ family response regulator
MDISMPGMNGLVATRTLKEQQPDMAVVTLTRHGDDAYLQELLRAGVSGYVLKQSAPAELLQAIRVAAAGGQYLDSTLTARVTAGFLARERRRVGKVGATISDRESEVLRLIARSERQDRRGTQGERHAQARTDRPDRHRQVRDPPGLAR